jgi:hypothetical protein
VTARTATEVAGELDKYREGLSLSDRLGDLASVVRSLDTDTPETDRARFWASVDLFAAFLGEASYIPDGGRGRIWRAVDSATQVLVFVPIAVTWFGLAWAAWVYRESVAAGQLRGESFLQAWQTGFGGRLPGLLTFDKLAISTFSLVFTLIVMTALHVVRQRWVAEPRQAELWRNLTDALVGADLVLAPYRLPAQELAAQRLDAAAEKVAALVGAFDAATSKMTDTASAVDAAAGNMAATAGAFDIAASTMTTLAGNVTVTIGAADTAAVKMAATAGTFDTAAGMMTAAAGAADTAAGRMAATAGTFDTSASTMTTAADKIAATVPAINATAAAITSTAASAADSQRKAADAIAAATVAFASVEGATGAATVAVTALEGASSRLGGHVDQLAAAGSQVALAERDLIDATGQASDRLAGALGDGADKVRDSLGDLAAFANYYANRVETAADAYGQAHKAIAGLPAIVTALGDEVRAIGGQLSSLNRVTAGMADLKASLEATGTASDRMAGVLTDGSDQVRAFLDNAGATASGYTRRVEDAANVLGQAQRTIDALPGTVGALAHEVSSLSGQLTDLPRVVAAMAELRQALDQVRVSADGVRSAQATAPPPYTPRRRGLLGRFRKRGIRRNGITSK